MSFSTDTPDYTQNVFASIRHRRSPLRQLARGCSTAEVDEFLYESALEVCHTDWSEIGLNVEIAPEGGVSNQKVDEIKVALRELGLSDDVSFD